MAIPIFPAENIAGRLPASHASLLLLRFAANGSSVPIYP